MSISFIKGTASYLNVCAEALYESELGRQYFPTLKQAEKAVKEFVDSDYFLVAMDAHKTFVGFICYLPTGAFHAFPYIHLFVTSKNKRSQGVGTQMMDLFEEQISKEKDKIFLVVADFNPRGYKFYEKRGYKSIGLIPSLYRKGVDEHLLMKNFY